MTRIGKANKRRNCFARSESRWAKRTVGSHLRWIIKGRARVPPRKAHVCGFDIFEWRQLPYTDHEGKIVDYMICKTPPELGMFTPSPYIVASPKAFSELMLALPKMGFPFATDSTGGAK